MRARSPQRATVRGSLRAFQTLWFAVTLKERRSFPSPTRRGPNYFNSVAAGSLGGPTQHGDEPTRRESPMGPSICDVPPSSGEVLVIWPGRPESGPPGGRRAIAIGRLAGPGFGSLAAQLDDRVERGGR